MKKAIAVIGAVIALALTACAEPLPPERSSYEGYWQGPDMALLITGDGRVEYKRVKGTATTEIKGPIQEFNGDNFDVGLGFMSTTFVVTAPPHEVDGQWKMTVDGVELTRQPPPATTISL